MELVSGPSGTSARLDSNTTPGSAPMLRLGQALAPQLAGDRDALQYVVRFEHPDSAFEAFARWRKRHVAALLVVDQFEELFTLNPPEVQARFAGLLGRLAFEADVHVLLSLRDDFLMACQRHAALADVFADLTPIGPPSAAGLRRALVEPAARRGYRSRTRRWWARCWRRSRANVARYHSSASPPRGFGNDATPTRTS
jgi:hypothetical protein